MLSSRKLTENEDRLQSNVVTVPWSNPLSEYVPKKSLLWWLHNIHQKEEAHMEEKRNNISTRNMRDFRKSLISKVAIQLLRHFTCWN